MSLSHSHHFYSFPFTLLILVYPTYTPHLYLCTSPPPRIAIPLHQSLAIFTSLTLLDAQIKPGSLSGSHLVKTPHNHPIKKVAKASYTRLLVCAATSAQIYWAAQTLPGSQPPKTALTVFPFPSLLQELVHIYGLYRTQACPALLVGHTNKSHTIVSLLQTESSLLQGIVYLIGSIFRAVSGSTTISMT